MATNRTITATNLLIWIAEAVFIALVGLYLAEYFDLSFVREAGGSLV